MKETKRQKEAKKKKPVERSKNSSSGNDYEASVLALVLEWDVVGTVSGVTG